jgi:ribosomal-protein-alanine N-acetyltransferase
MGLGGVIRGKRTLLRTPTEDDLVPIARWMADMRVRHAARVWHEPAMPATWKERFTEQTKDKTSALWSIDADGGLVGIARVGFGWEPHRDSCHISDFFVDPEHWRKGYASDALIALHRYLFDYLDLRRVATAYRGDNDAARRIGERLGYTEFARGHEAHYRDGAYVDHVWAVMDRPVWEERWGTTEREYEPLGSVRTPGTAGGD